MFYRICACDFAYITKISIRMQRKYLFTLLLAVFLLSSMNLAAKPKQKVRYYVGGSLPVLKLGGTLGLVLTEVPDANFTLASERDSYDAFSFDYAIGVRKLNGFLFIGYWGRLEYSVSSVTFPDRTETENSLVHFFGVRVAVSLGFTDKNTVFLGFGGLPVGTYSFTNNNGNLPENTYELINNYRYTGGIVYSVGYLRRLNKKIQLGVEFTYKILTTTSRIASIEGGVEINREVSEGSSSIGELSFVIGNNF